MTAAKALRMLFEHSRNTLPVENLDQLTLLTEQAQMEAGNIAATLETLAMLYGNGSSETPDDFGLSQILFGLSGGAAVVSEMIFIAEDAEYLAANKRTAAADSAAQNAGHKKTDDQI